MACEKILHFCEAGGGPLVLPAYSLMEPLETVRRRQVSRRRAKNVLEEELRQLARTATYKTRLRDVELAAALLVDSSEEDLQRLASIRSRLLACAELIPLDSSVLARVVNYQDQYDFSAQDAVVYASILANLVRSRGPTCFVSRDRDFDDQEIEEELKAYDCKLFSDFVTGYQFLQGLDSGESV